MATVKLLSHMATAAGTAEVEIEAATVGRLIRILEERFGDEFGTLLKACKVIVNGRSVVALKLKRTPLRPGDEVSLLPPLAGG